MNTYETNFNKNLGALEEYNTILADKIEDVKTNKRFEVFAGENTFDINIYDHELKQNLYDNPEKFFDEKYNEIYSKYERYPVLFFYGLGNGLLYKALLKNENHKSIIVFEPNIEILYIVFHLIDFSQELKDKRLYVVENFDKTHLNIFLGKELHVRNYLQNIKLFTHSPYYNNYKDVCVFEKNTQELCLNLITELGNDPKDSLQGITQLLHNLPYQLANPSLKDLLKQRKDKIENAIIVSTGPSLIKQLPLLKEYASKASIICADSAYPILAKHNIKPDYVLSLERIERTSEFFNNDFGDFDKDILFVLVSMVFPKTIEYLKKNGRNFMLVHRPLPFAQSLNMNDYGYLGSGMSVANMAYELAVKLGHKNIILIGQDLAYGEDGNSHPKDYHYFKEDFEGSRKQGLFVTAYGGNKEVETNRWWKIFKETFEKDIALMNPLDIKTYNATEGGARIEGSIEKPFKELCEELLREDKVLFGKLQGLNEKEFKDKKDEISKRLDYKIQKISQILINGKNLKEELKDTLNYTSHSNNIHELDFKKILNTNDSLHLLKADIEKMLELGEVLNPALKNIELELAKISLMSAHTQEDKKIRMITWLLKHELWIEQLIKYLDILLEILQKEQK
ncbi:motility associated factor glycosyltransferase family protein [Campylobacter ornithocola]|uniref:motility associated factor glycosyltransferase family protein n=3 Tax=Campylobacter ornithocola TaxID=1848766 RepID=UPI00155DDE49|nr:motility associated factor glycosyltransferase family protein [Campylobacter ornithocola]QKF56736.1 motility accessory factor [Campylobacter ornithocola]